MADRPPVFRHAGWKPRKAWARSSKHEDKRIRGRAGQRIRAQVLAEEPFCRHCLPKGQRVRSEEVDHVVPLSQGGENHRSNLQALCKPCHEAKTIAERANSASDSAIGQGFRKN